MSGSIAAIMLTYATAQRPCLETTLAYGIGAWSLPELLDEIATRDATIKQQCEIEQLRERVEGQSEVLARTQQALLNMRAELTHARHEMFGASRERMSAWQLDLFDQAHEAPLPPQQPDLSIPVEGRRRKRRSKGRPALLSNPIERVVHPMPEQGLWQYDRVTVIGETVTRTLKYTPARMSVVEHVCPRYALVKSGVPTVRGTTFQASSLMKSNASPEPLARFVVAHFDSGLPFYRLEEEFAMHGLRVRATRWATGPFGFQSWCCRCTKRSVGRCSARG